MPSWRDTENPGEPDSTRNTAGPAWVIAGTTTMPATWPAMTYHRLPRRYHPWADRPASTLSDPGDQRPSRSLTRRPAEAASTARPSGHRPRAARRRPGLPPGTDRGTAHGRVRCG